MRVLIPLVLAVLLLGGGGGLYAFYQYMNSDASKFTLNGDNSGKSPLGMAARIMAENATGAATTTPDVDLSNLLPEARPGWFRQDYANPHGEALTGRAIIHSAVIKSTSNTMLLRFETDSKNRRGHYAYTYSRGDLRVMVRTRKLEQLNRNTTTGAMMGDVADNMAAAMVGMEEEGPDRRFAVMDGVHFIQEAPFNYIRLERRSVPADYRVFNAKILGQVHIQIMTNASDNAVAETIKMLDVASILQQLGHPVTRPGFTTHLPEPLSQERPAQTPGQAAFALLQTDHGLSENEIRKLRKISAGDIETQEQVDAKVGARNQMSQTFRDFLDAQTFPPQAVIELEVDRQAAAADLIKFMPRAAPSEFVLLHMIRTKQVETYDEAKRFFPHINAMSRQTQSLLLGYDPAAQAQETAARIIQDTNGRGDSVVVDLNEAPPAVATNTVAKPTVRRFSGSSGLTGTGSCAIVDGVRRCVLSDG